MNHLFEEMITVANRKVIDMVKDAVKKRGIADEPGYKNITRVVDLENHIDYYYAGYPKKKVLIFSMQTIFDTDNDYPKVIINLTPDQL